MTETTTETIPADDAATGAAAEKETEGNAAAEAAKADDGGEIDAEILKSADNPDAVKKAIQAERERAKAAKKAADDAAAELEAERKKVKDFEDRDKSEQEKAEQLAAEKGKEAADATSKLLRLEVALDKKLPAKLAARLTGETKTELEADADELLKLVKEEDSVSVDGGARKPTKTPDDMNARIRAAAGR